MVTLLNQLSPLLNGRDFNPNLVLVTILNVQIVSVSHQSTGVPFTGFDDTHM